MTQVFGQTYAPAYDLLYREKDYDAEVELLGRLFHRYGNGPVQSILDLGCGTGNHALRLAAKGYRVVGVDRSAEMLAIADRKAREQGVNLRVHQADIRNIVLGETFDAALMMFAVLGYQLQDADVLGAMQTARRHLRQNGLLIFDVWYGPAVLAQGPEERVRTVEDNGTTLTRISSGRLEPERNICHVEFHVIKNMADKIIGESREMHAVRYFSPDEIGRFLDDAGFRLLRLGAFPNVDSEPDRTTWNVIVVGSAL